MPTARTTDGVTIHYEATGAGRAVVLVHGITDSGDDWGPVTALLGEDHRVIVVDLRGHGRSGDADDYGALAMASDVAAVVAAEHASAPLLVGHSLGGVVVTAAAAAVGARGVVNVDQPLRFSDFKGALEPLVDALRGPGFAEALASVFAAMEGDRLDPPTRASLAANRARARQGVVLGVWSMVFDSTPEDLDAVAAGLLPSVTVPYLALHGLPVAPGYEDWLRGLLPQAAVEHWEGHGHYPHRVDPHRFVERVRAFDAEVP